MTRRLSRALAVAWFAGMGLFLAELAVLQSDAYVGSPPWTWILGCAGLVLVGLARFLRTCGAAPRDALMLGLLWAGLSGALAYHGALHLNRWTDPLPLLATAYTLQKDRGLLPRENAAAGPRLHFQGEAEYWSQQRTGSEHRFLLRRGALGFWQVDRRAYLRDIDAWHQRRWNPPIRLRGSTATT